MSPATWDSTGCFFLCLFVLCGCFFCFPLGIQRWICLLLVVCVFCFSAWDSTVMFLVLWSCLFILHIWLYSQVGLKSVEDPFLQQMKPSHTAGLTWVGTVDQAEWAIDHVWNRYGIPLVPYKPSSWKCLSCVRVQRDVLVHIQMKTWNVITSLLYPVNLLSIAYCRLKTSTTIENIFQKNNVLENKHYM